MRIYWIDFFKKGNLGLMARPKGGDWLENEIIKLQRNNVDTVVCLLQRDEIYDLDIAKEKEFCEKLDINYIGHPIVDRSVPDEETTFKQLIFNLYSQLEKGNRVVVHCRMGIGRASLVVAALLLKADFRLDDVFDYIGERRTLKVPDTEEQISWLKQRAHFFSK